MELSEYLKRVAVILEALAKLQCMCVDGAAACLVCEAMELGKTDTALFVAPVPKAVPRTMTPAEYAEEHQMSKSTVLNRLRSGKLAGEQSETGRWRVRVES